MSEATITAITELEGESYKTKIFSGGHFIYADEPKPLGGTDEGMSPGALLLASLGSCTAITVRMYATRRSFPLTGVTVELGICPEDKMNKSTTITRKVTLKGDLNEHQRARLMEIADKCPIHRIMSNPIRIIDN